MANHSYVQYNRRRVTLTADAVEMLLKEFCHERFGDNVTVERQEDSHMVRQGYTVWHCVIPGSEIADNHAAMKFGMAPGEPLGFPVWYRPGLLEFRHHLNCWARWAQRCIEEDFAMHTNGEMTSDHDDKEVPARRESSNFRTVRAYLTRSYKKPLTDDAAEWIERLMSTVPECFRG